MTNELIVELATHDELTIAYSKLILKGLNILEHSNDSLCCLLAKEIKSQRKRAINRKIYALKKVGQAK